MGSPRAHLPSDTGCHSRLPRAAALELLCTAPEEQRGAHPPRVQARPPRPSSSPVHGITKIPSLVEPSSALSRSQIGDPGDNAELCPQPSSARPCFQRRRTRRAKARRATADQAFFGSSVTLVLKIPAPPEPSAIKTSDQGKSSLIKAPCFILPSSFFLLFAPPAAVKHDRLSAVSNRKPAFAPKRTVRPSPTQSNQLPKLLLILI